MARYSIEDTTLTNIANKIRNKTNSAAAIRVKDWEDAIDSINAEDVAEETNAYTTKISQLETAVTALETELAGKASGGSDSGSVETCTVTLNANAPLFGDENITAYYTDGSLTSKSTVCTLNGDTLTVTKNTVFFIHPWSTSTATNGSCTEINATGTGGGAYIITGDCTIIYGG